jgi:hypothetical protein
MTYACTINEPQGLGSSGWLLGINPPGHNDDPGAECDVSRDYRVFSRPGSVVSRD